ncbi:hypothetical protein B1M_08857, partial [Burkholderia sp. TJI49]
KRGEQVTSCTRLRDFLMSTLRVDLHEERRASR